MLADISPETVGQLGIGITILGFFLWMIRHAITVTFPLVMDKILKVITDERAWHKEDLKAERELCAKNHQEQMTRREADRVENVELHQDTRHAIRDMAHAAGLKRFAEDMEKRNDAGPRAGG